MTLDPQQDLSPAARRVWNKLQGLTHYANLLVLALELPAKDRRILVQLLKSDHRRTSRLKRHATLVAQAFMPEIAAIYPKLVAKTKAKSKSKASST